MKKLLIIAAVMISAATGVSASEWEYWWGEPDSKIELICTGKFYGDEKFLYNIKTRITIGVFNGKSPTIQTCLLYTSPSPRD